MSQKQQVLTMLEEAGERGVTGNQFYAAFLPRFAARIKELRDEGHSITTERIESNRFLYKLRVDGQGKSGALRKPASVDECSRTGGAVEPGTGGSGLGNPAASCGPVPVGDVALDEGGESSAGATPLAPVDPPRLFEVEGASYYEREAA